MLGSVLVVLVLLGVAGPAAAQAEHEHMLIGSTAPGGGSVILQYDFTRLTVVEAPTFSSIDPSFAPQLVDDPSVPIYALTAGTAVRVEIVALDDGTSLTVNEATLDRPGDRKKIGDAPVLHDHVTWALDVPSGVIGDFHISFKIVASGPYADSPVYTDHDHEPAAGHHDDDDRRRAPAPRPRRAPPPRARRRRARPRRRSTRRSTRSSAIARRSPRASPTSRTGRSPSPTGSALPMPTRRTSGGRAIPCRSTTRSGIPTSAWSASR